MNGIFGLSLGGLGLNAPPPPSGSPPPPPSSEIAYQANVMTEDGPTFLMLPANAFVGLEGVSVIGSTAAAPAPESTTTFTVMAADGPITVTGATTTQTRVAGVTVTH